MFEQRRPQFKILLEMGRAPCGAKNSIAMEPVTCASSAREWRRFRVSTIERLVQLWCQTGADRGVRTTTDADTSLAVCGIRTTIYQKSALSNYSASLPVGLVMGRTRRQLHAAAKPKMRDSPMPRQVLIHHPKPLPISASFGVRYLHTLMRRWAASRKSHWPRVGACALEW